MRTRCISFGLLVLLSGSLVAQTPDPGKLAAVSTRMQKFADEGEFAGSVTVVGRANGVVHLDAVGYRNIEKQEKMTKNTVFRIASMTKPITALAIMMLVDEGKLAVNDPLEKYIPEFKGQMLVASRDAGTVTLKKPGRPITIADLLTHTSGLPGGYPGAVGEVYRKRNYTLAETTLVLSQQPLQFEPGSKWAYCNAGIDTLGRLVEVVSGESFETFLRTRLFAPLAMNDTRFYPGDDQVKRIATIYSKKDGKLTPANNLILEVPPEAKHPVPAGGLYSTGPDLAKLYTMFLNRGVRGNTRFLSEKSLQDMTTIHTGELKAGFVEGTGFGYGFAIVAKPAGVTEMLNAGTYGHGGAFGTQAWIDPKNDAYYVLLIARSDLPNSDASPIRREFQALAVEALKP